ncbi:MAG: ABC transporter permease [Deltaproteobacteria bacterium]|nr:ABC transporter permease [Deltaproteobacteria bacterium]
MLAALDALGGYILYLLETLGRYGRMCGASITMAFRRPFRVHMIIEQAVGVGVNSSVIILLTSLFTGMVFSLQLGSAFQRFGAEGLIGGATMLALVRELGPVLTALMVTGRCGSAMAAELGTMRVTEQIDALGAMGIDPVKYLVVPRVIATTLVVPVLTLIFVFVGGVGSYFVSTVILNISPGGWWQNVIELIDMGDLNNMWIKSTIFGFTLATVGCYVGFFTTGGARGVGRSTTRSVVTASVLVLVGDYFITSLLLNLGIGGSRS